MASDHIPGDSVWRYLRCRERPAIDGTALVPAQPAPDACVAEAMSISATEKWRKKRREDEQTSGAVLVSDH
jgi:hypothetical protein